MCAELLPLILITVSGLAGAQEPGVIRATEGGEVVLPCSHRTSGDLEPKRFQWTKDAQEGQPVLSVYTYGADFMSSRQSMSFLRRVRPFHSELQHGNASIVLRRLQLEDSGDYTCRFPHGGQTCHVRLVVEEAPAPEGGSLGSPGDSVVTIVLPVVIACLVIGCALLFYYKYRSSFTIRQQGALIMDEGSDVVLPCFLSSRENIETRSFEWKKDARSNVRKREVFAYSGGDTSAPLQDDQFRGRVSHFPEELKHGNASILLRALAVGDSGDYTCVLPHVQPKGPMSYIRLAVRRRN